MIVLTLTDCPPSLRGELTRWLLEINTGVYVGRVSARVRDQIWERVQKQAKAGRATLVYSSAHNEQRLDFRTHQSDWEPIDFDGLKLMLRPSTIRPNRPKTELADGFSKAAQLRKSRQMERSRRKNTAVAGQYVVIDVETTGLSPDADQIIEIGAIQVKDRQVEATLQSLVKISGSIPHGVVELTGITDDMLQADGGELREVLSAFLHFVGDQPVVAHNGDFDFRFIRAACERLGLPLFGNRFEDTLSLSKHYVKGLGDYRLETMTAHFDITVSRLHRSLDDCFASMQLYEKLNEFREGR